jgi:hypothetical protein
MFDLNGHHRAAGQPAHLRFTIGDLRVCAAKPLVQNSKFQAPTSREAPKPEHPILQVWCLNILWGLDVEIWMLTLNVAHRRLGIGGFRLIHHANCESSKMMHFTQKSLVVSRCGSMALTLNYGKLRAKKSHFFTLPKHNKSLGNQAKTLKKVSPICRNFEGNPGVLFIQGGAAAPPYRVRGLSSQKAINHSFVSWCCCHEKLN